MCEYVCEGSSLRSGVFQGAFLDGERTKITNI